MNKLNREVQRALSRIGVKVIQRQGDGGHTRLTVRLPTGELHTITMACSPKNADHTINNVVRDVRNLSTNHLKGTSP